MRARQAVVALPNAILSITDEDQIILAGFTARVRFSQGRLYMLDERTGQIWSVSGLQSIGRFQDDERHAFNLLDRVGLDDSETNPRFLEAARIIGCERAQQRLAERPRKPHSNPVR